MLHVWLYGEGDVVALIGESSQSQGEDGIDSGLGFVSRDTSLLMSQQGVWQYAHCILVPPSKE